VQFGLLGRETRYGDGTWTTAESAVPVLPRADWQPINNSHLVKVVFSQLDGHCAANASVQCLACLREQSGQPFVELSPHSLYMQHSRWGTGSSLDENLRQLRDVGVMTMATFPESKCPRLIIEPSHWTREQRDEAMQYRVLEWYDCDGSFDLGASALQRGMPVVIGLRWPGGGGHSVLATDLAKKGNEWAFRGPNSWGASWGDKGFFALTESQMRSGPGYGSWAGRSCVIV
jgi:hypothetical protein